MKRTLREQVQPPPKIRDVSITKGSTVSFGLLRQKNIQEKSLTIYTGREHTFYCLDRVISEDGKVIENVSVRDDSILKIEISNHGKTKKESFMRLAEAKQIVRAAGYTVLREDEEVDKFSKLYGGYCDLVTEMGEGFKRQVDSLAEQYMGESAKGKKVWYEEVLGDVGFDLGHHNISRREKRDPQYVELKREVRNLRRRFERKVKKLLESPEAYELGDDLSVDLYESTLEKIGLPLIHKYY